ncbi:serine incorporator [Blastocystis sp. ATCC 50177/Nand II]|uniref:Serine incorporator n=1 Tax=Blastocystis sp. subtype 1 (strain ATCC 50177 / NandII) TaxID=478820 RepID=A0A196S8U7_BLAHN|nr:serine incorporator [Blastocystis sp. ATCC 50177/Nand II]
MVLGINPLSILFCTCGTITGNAKKKMSNPQYYTIYLIWMIICLVFEYIPSEPYVNSKLDKIFGTHGIEIVYRISASIAASFLLLFLCTLAWPWTHHMFMGIFFVVLLLMGWLFIWGIKSDAWIVPYRSLCRIVSFFYLVLQLMAFVDFSFTLHEMITAKLDETNKRYKYTEKTCCCRNQWTSMYLTLSFVLCVGSIAACIAFYFIFRVNGSLCARNIIVITITLAMGILITFMCITEKINRGFLPPAVFFAITVFYLLSALLTNSSDACNPFKNVSTFGITLINLFLNVTSGYWMAYRIRNEKVDEPDVESVQTDKKEEGAVSIPDEDSRQWCVFNFCMVLASMYLSMMCSAWYDGDIKERSSQIFDFSSPMSFWVYNSSIWIAFLVFLYILVAPMVNTNRTYV